MLRGERLPRDFDDACYLQLNPDVSINARKHYLLYGHAEGRPYKSANDERCADPYALRQNLAHRDKEIGELRGALAERGNELAALKAEAAEREARIAALGTLFALCASISWRITAPLRFVKRLLRRFHHSGIGYPLTLGWQALRTCSLAPLREWRAVRVIARSGLFDSEWYLKNNPDAAAWGIDPIRHYVAFGAWNGRDPSPSFSTRAYLSHNKDVAAAKVNPFSHFLLYGIIERRAGANFTWNQLSGHQLLGTSSSSSSKTPYAGPKLSPSLKNLRRHLASRNWDRLQAHRSRLVRDYAETQGGAGRASV